MSHFGYIGHHLKIVAIKKTIYRSWLGDVQWGHLMTHVEARCSTKTIKQALSF